MSTDRPDEQDLRFERTLLRSAQADNPTHDTRAAWERFTAVTAYVASRVDSVSAVHRVGTDPFGARQWPPSNGLHTPTALPRPELTQAAAGITLSGVGVGVVLGALLSAGVWFWVGSAAQPDVLAQVNPRPNSTAPASTAATRLGLGGASTPLPSTPVAQQVASSTPLPSDPAASEGVTDTQRSPQGSTSRVNTGSKRTLSAAPSGNVSQNPSLAAQVRLLDHARDALRAGRPSYALSWVERARAEFPDSVLTPDWDFVEIEALRLQGAALAEERARTFLRKYPTDPHAPEVQRRR